MSKYNELVTKLKEIFQIDRADLDFGIYRILNARATEITDFLDNRLKEKVQSSFKAGATNITEHENKVYSHLLTFFTRYYDSGDFISQRRYKGDTYAIPYSGEEVMLHWANRDQYYTKSGENFSNYSFKLDDGRKVHFKLVTADTAKDNRKDNNESRLFSLIEKKTIAHTDDEVSSIEKKAIIHSDVRSEEYEDTLLPVEQIETDGLEELVLRFEYAAFPKTTKQNALIDKALERILADSVVKSNWKDLTKRDPVEKNPQRTLLQKHLTNYTAKNTADYFIHKDLDGFLQRELDFYIKNEVMNLDNIQNSERFSDIEKNLQMIQCLRGVASDLIDFLAQLENFQKKLWLKKKFVVSSNYCITLDRVPEFFYKEIASNDRQWAQWSQLGLVSEKPIKSKTIDYFKDNKYLMVDTSLYPPNFKLDLISKIDHVNEQLNGKMIYGDNFQGLNLIQSLYKEQVKSVYIDPPFNLGQNADFHYKTDYKDSSWLALLNDRLILSKNLLHEKGYLFVRCDINGNFLVRNLLNSLMDSSNFQAEFLVQRIRKNVTTQGKISIPLANDSLFLFSNTIQSSFVNPYIKLNQTREAYWRRIDDSAGFRNPPERTIFGKTFYPYKRDAHFKYSQISIDLMTEEGRIRLKCKECSTEHLKGKWINCKKCGHSEAVPQYLVKETDIKILDTNWLDIPGYAHTTGFSTENSEALLTRSLELTSAPGDLVLDYFSGSGTTQATAMKLGRKWLGVEQGEQFDNIIIPRLKKTAYNHKLSHFFKIVRLESYEDTLNNLSLLRSVKQSDLLQSMNEDCKNDYLLHYMLDLESRDSLLSTSSFKNPFDFKLKIAVDSAGAYEDQKIDLVETFNYLVGLRTERFFADLDRGYIACSGLLPDNKLALIFWRDCDLLTNETVSSVYTELCQKLELSPDIIYINGDHNLPVFLKANKAKLEFTSEPHVHQIEPEFLTKMFKVEEI